MKKDILAIVAVAAMAVGCNSSDEVQQNAPIPIKLTASVGVEAITRGADGKVIETDATTRGIQENALADNQKIYVWAKEDGSSSWDFLKAWTLTAGSTGLSGNAKYYPLDGSTITMNAVHGNFAETLTEDATTATSLTHSVKANQSDDYEVSDLLFGSATGSDASTTENIALTHKLSKIEVNLSPGYGYDATDLTSSVVTLNNVKPTITIDPTNGTLGTTATGTAVTITTRKDATTGTYEAVIPPQTFTNPDAFIAVTTTKDGHTLTSTVPNDVATYAENARYVYNVVVRGLRPKLPMDYCGQYNMMSATEMAPNHQVSKTAYFRWGTSTSTMTSTMQSFKNGITISGQKYHLPSTKELSSILAGTNVSYGNGSYLNQEEAIAWGVTNTNGSYTYEVDRTFYSDYEFPASTKIGYALRLRESTGNGIYTCAYRYQYNSTDSETGNGSTRIKIIYIGEDPSVTLETINKEAWWNGRNADVEIVFPNTGHKSRGSSDLPAGSFTSSGGYQQTEAYAWSTDVYSSTYIRCAKIYQWGPNALASDYPDYLFTVRLFKDKE